MEEKKFVEAIKETANDGMYAIDKNDYLNRILLMCIDRMEQLKTKKEKKHGK